MMCTYLFRYISETSVAHDLLVPVNLTPCGPIEHPGLHCRIDDQCVIQIDKCRSEGLRLDHNVIGREVSEVDSIEKILI